MDETDPTVGTPQRDDPDAEDLGTSGDAADGGYPEEAPKGADPGPDVRERSKDPEDPSGA